jgi:polyvinyl alcohol dehydrogenase (cytochrome)
VLYFPDRSGNLYKIDTETGNVLWSRQISDYNGIPGSVSRNSPLIVRDRIILGDQNASFVMAIDAGTGRLVWKTRADPNEYAIITQSLVGYENRVFVGAASQEEAVVASVPGYVPTFRGSVLALDVATGAILWKTHSVPEGYTGGAVWGSTPVVDFKRGSLYIATGNNYSVPPGVAACIAAAGNDRREADECLAPDDYIDSIVALDLVTGAIKWAKRLQGADTWTVSCIVPTPANPCPVPTGPDYDFASGPSLFTATRNGERVELLGAGQKSGIYWALNPDNGNVVWSTKVGPGGGLGGIQWGSATDGHRVYVAISNSDHKMYRLTPSGVPHNAGSWAALDASSGRIVWQVKVPGVDPSNPSLGALGLGAVTIANGVLYAGAMASGLYALDAATGQQLWSFPVSAPVICGPSVVNGTIYWGTGYFGPPVNKLYAFEAKQRDDFADSCTLSFTRLRCLP